MIGLIVILLMTFAALSGGLIALFAGRRFYAVWLGFAAYFLTTRILDLALFRLPEAVRNWGGLFIAVLVVVAVVLLRHRVIRLIPPIGGFFVGALIGERLLGIVAPEAGKYLFFASLLLGGVVGVFLFIRLLDFDNAVIDLSAIWGASYVTTFLFDILDIFVITAIGQIGGIFSGILNLTQLLQAVVWLGLAAIGIVVQRKLGYKPIEFPEKVETEEADVTSQPKNRRGWVVGGLIGSLLIIFILASVVSGNSSLSKSIRTSINNFQRSLGMEAETPGDAPWQWASTLLRPRLTLEENDRILVLVPHPDDDILSTAGTIQQALDKGLPVKVVLFTNGDYNETSFALYRKEITISPTQALRLAETRREEALVAQIILGVKPDQVTFLGYPDGGGLEIFEKYWGDNSPSYRGLLSEQSSVPYTFAQTPYAPYKGESIVSDLEKILIDYKPTKIFTSHPGDVHPDHQTLPLFLQIALWNLEDQVKPAVYHFITHYGRWPQPRGYQPEHPLNPPAQFDVDNRWVILPITPEQEDKKLEALKAHKTQWGSGQAYLESIVRTNELFDVVNEIPISQGQEVHVLPAEAAAPSEAAQFLPDVMQNAFVNGEVRTVKLDGDELVLSVTFDQALTGDVHAKVWTMGYRKDKPFGGMPKIFMDLSPGKTRVFDRGHELPSDYVTVSGTPTHSEVRIPLSLLNNPERVMVSAQTSIGDVPLDNIPWVFLKLEL